MRLAMSIVRAPSLLNLRIVMRGGIDTYFGDVRGCIQQGGMLLRENSGRMPTAFHAIQQQPREDEYEVSVCII